MEHVKRFCSRIVWGSRRMNVELKFWSDEVVPFNSFFTGSKSIQSNTREFFECNRSNILNEKPMIGLVRLFGWLTMETMRLFWIKDFSDSSTIKFWEYRSSDDNNLLQWSRMNWRNEKISWWLTWQNFDSFLELLESISRRRSYRPKDRNSMEDHLSVHFVVRFDPLNLLRMKLPKLIENVWYYHLNKPEYSSHPLNSSKVTERQDVLDCLERISVHLPSRFLRWNNFEADFHSIEFWLLDRLV